MNRIRLMMLAVALFLTVAAVPELVGLGTAEAVTYCTKEQCSVARAECREWCPYPCVMRFECTTPYCGSCISCTC